MKTTLRVLLKLTSAFFLLSCLNACESKSDSQGTSAKQTINERAPELASANAQHAHAKGEQGFQHHQPLVKPGAAVSLKSTQPLIASVPGVYEYQLELISPIHMGKMTVNVPVGKGFEIVSAAHQFEFELREGGEYRVPLLISAGSEGRFYIQLHVSITADGQSSSRVVAAILQVGEPSAKVQKAAEKSNREEDTSVISLPAQETISPR